MSSPDNMHTPNIPRAGSASQDDIKERFRRMLAEIEASSPVDVPTPYDCSFEQFCTDRLLDVVRPFGRTVSRGTYENMARHLRSEQMGPLLSDDGHALAPPDWQKFRQLLRKHEKGPQALENQRRALYWWSAYYRVPVPNQPWARKRLDDKTSVALARRQGIVEERVRFFRPEHLQKLVAVPRTRDNPRSHDHRLNRETFRTIVYTSVYVGPRGGEPWYWRLGDFNEKLGTLDVWAQKQSKRRTVAPPEPYALVGRSMNPHTGEAVYLDPTIARYLREVRPLLDPEEKFSSPDDPIFLFMGRGDKVRVHDNQRTKQRHGWATESAYREFISRGVHAVLGADVAGPHGFRRACATLRYRHGASIAQIARFIGDADATIARSYLDYEWLDSPSVDILAPPKVGLARIPRLRPDQFISHGRAPRGAGASDSETMP